MATCTPRGALLLVQSVVQLFNFRGALVPAAEEIVIGILLYFPSKPRFNFVGACWVFQQSHQMDLSCRAC